MSALSSNATVIACDAVPYLEQNENEIELPHLNCQIQPSSLTCLVGPNHLYLKAYLLMLAGISNSLQGNITIFGEIVSTLDQTEWAKLRLKIGYFSGTSPLLSVQHGLMNVMLPALYEGHLSFREVADKAKVLLTELKCQVDPSTFPAMLNNFQRSQLGLARALILDPSLLFLDVPFHNLGAKEREIMGSLLEKFKKHRAICMIGDQQYSQFLKQHADQIIFISEHKIIKFNSWSAFMQSKDQDTQELLGTLQITT